MLLYLTETACPAAATASEICGIVPLSIGSMNTERHRPARTCIVEQEVLELAFAESRIPGEPDQLPKLRLNVPRRPVAAEVHARRRILQVARQRPQDIAPGV